MYVYKVNDRDCDKWFFHRESQMTPEELVAFIADQDPQDQNDYSLALLNPGDPEATEYLSTRINELSVLISDSSRVLTKYTKSSGYHMYYKCKSCGATHVLVESMTELEFQQDLSIMSKNDVKLISCECSPRGKVNCEFLKYEYVEDQNEV